MNIPRSLPKTSAKPATIALTAAAMAMASLSSASSASYYLKADMGANENANNLAIWWSNPDGSGTNPLTMAGNDFFSNGFGFRFQTTASTGGTFAGDTLTLNSTGNLKIPGTSTNNPGYTVDSLTTAPPVGANPLQQLGLLANSGTANTFATINNFSVQSGTVFGLSNAGALNTYFYLTVGNMSGLGTLSIGAAVGGNGPAASGNVVYLSVANAANYSGQIRWGSSVSSNVTLNFDSDFISSGSLLARSNDRIALDQNLTFSSVTLGGTTLAAGTYDYTYLKSNFSQIFTDGGSGSITVVPEPAAYGLLFAGMLAVAVWRRARVTGKPRA